MEAGEDIEIIFVDLDGVLRHWPDDVNALEKKYGLTEGSINAVAFSQELLQPAIRGITSDSEWREQVAAKLEKMYQNVDSHSAIAEWSSLLGQIDKDVLSLLFSCHERASIILTTNATSRLVTDLNALGINDIFDSIVNSSEIGVVKPESNYFTQALEVAGVDANRAVFIDDSLENVIGAEENGIKSHHFRDIIELDVFLVAYGLRPIKSE